MSDDTQALMEEVQLAATELGQAKDEMRAIYARADQVKANIEAITAGYRADPDGEANRKMWMRALGREADEMESLNAQLADVSARVTQLTGDLRRAKDALLSALGAKSEAGAHECYK